MIEEHIVAGPVIERVIDSSLGDLLLVLLKSHCDNVLQVDAYTGAILPANLLLDRAIRVANYLRSKGIGVGDSVSINSENRLEFCIVPVAVLFVGATFAPLNPDYTPGELKHVLNLSKPKIVFCSPKTVEKMVKILPVCPYLEDIVAFESRSYKCNNVTMYETLVAGATGVNIDENFKTTPLDPKETVATILCSSGTTGLPKGVMCTHDNMTCCIDVMRTILSEMMDSIDMSDAIMGLAPFFHSFGFMLLFLNILRGRKMVVFSKFNLKQFLDAIVKYKIVRVVVPPPVMLALLKHPMTKNYDFSKIKEIRTGAAPMGKDMERELKEKLKVGHVSQGYGMTETTFGTLVSPFSKSKFGSVGKVVPGMVAKVIDAQGRSLGAFSRGELCFKGPLIMKGYVGDETSTANTIDKYGWLHTGDIAYYDDEGYFFIVDRIKELIKYKGYQVAPAELEALLLTHAAVEDAAVVGIPNEDAGELPLAFIVRKPNQTVTEAEIQRFVAENVSPPKRLRGGVIFINTIPRNPAGKILRRKLRDQAKHLKAKL